MKAAFIGIPRFGATKVAFLIDAFKLARKPSNSKDFNSRTEGRLHDATSDLFQNDVETGLPKYPGWRSSDDVKSFT
jgi:hypothetical protein